MSCEVMQFKFVNCTQAHENISYSYSKVITKHWKIYSVDLHVWLNASHKVINTENKFHYKEIFFSTAQWHAEVGWRLSDRIFLHYSLCIKRSILFDTLREINLSVFKIISAILDASNRYSRICWQSNIFFFFKFSIDPLCLLQKIRDNYKKQKHYFGKRLMPCVAYFFLSLSFLASIVSIQHCACACLWRVEVWERKWWVLKKKKRIIRENPKMNMKMWVY